MEEAQKNNVDYIMASAREMMNSFENMKNNHSTSIDTNGLGPAPRAPKRSYTEAENVAPLANTELHKSKHAVVTRTVSSDGSASSPVIAPRRIKKATNKFCERHRVTTHNTEDCRVVQEEQRQAATATITPSNVPSYSSGPQDRTCRKCGAH
ncbi:hypothetical protein ABG067_008014, partial [Albugo candida]